MQFAQKKFIRLVRGIRLQYGSKVDGMNASKRECVNAWSPAAGRRHFNGPYDDMQFRNESVAWFVAFGSAQRSCVSNCTSFEGYKIFPIPFPIAHWALAPPLSALR